MKDCPCTKKNSSQAVVNNIDCPTAAICGYPSLDDGIWVSGIVCGGDGKVEKKWKKQLRFTHDAKICKNVDKQAELLAKSERPKGDFSCILSIVGHEGYRGKH